MGGEGGLEREGANSKIVALEIGLMLSIGGTLIELLQYLVSVSIEQGKQMLSKFCQIHGDAMKHDI